VAIGYISGAHGIAGELRLKLFHPETRLVRRGGRLLVQKDGAERIVVVTKASLGAQPRIAFHGVVDREAAEQLVGATIAVPRDALPPAAEGEVYLADLVGLRVVVGENELGVVESVVHHPASDCVRVREAGGLREVPLTPPYLVEIDLGAGCVRLLHVEDFELAP
jgi:16S rRNA processing protein RimM